MRLGCGSCHLEKHRLSVVNRMISYLCFGRLQPNYALHKIPEGVITASPASELNQELSSVARFSWVSRSLPFNAHSQMTSTRQPLARNNLMFFWSLARLVLIFDRQNSVRDFGSLKMGQSWPCQKQPFTKMVELCLRSVMSGFPGNVALCNLNR